MVYLFIETYRSEATYVASHIDNREYLVRNLEDKEDAANTLAKIRQDIFKLKNHLVQNADRYPEYRKYIDLFNRRIKDVVISESSDNSEYTSYSVNKGEEIVFCLRSKLTQEIHDPNLIMYVAIHELAHVACPEVGHTDLFRKIFRFLLSVAIELKIYHYVNYRISPNEYCGMMITDNIL